MNELAKKLLELNLRFTEAMLDDPQLREALRGREGDETQLIIMPVFDEELAQYVIDLLVRPASSDITRRVVVYVTGSMEQLEVMATQVWSREQLN